MKILIINGPNLNLILSRKKEFYGEMDILSIQDKISSRFPEIKFDFFTSNIESEIIEVIQQAEKSFSGIIINPGAFTHSSIGIRDALEICKLPKIEVHLSNLSIRDKFRNVFLTTANCDGYISGFKDTGYLAAVFTMIELLKSKTKNSL